MACAGLSAELAHPGRVFLWKCCGKHESERPESKETPLGRLTWVA